MRVCDVLADHAMESGSWVDDVRDEVIIDIENSGHSDISNLIGSMTTSSSYISINNPSLINTSSLMSNQQTSMSFNITIDANTPSGSLVDFNFNVNNLMILWFLF